MNDKQVSKIFDLILKGDKKSIKQAQELIRNDDMSIPDEPESNKSENHIVILAYKNDNGDPDIRQAIETIKLLTDIENLKMVKAIVAKRIVSLRYNKSE